MASRVNPNTVNPNFPLPGQDNDSRGFRDNFSAIRDNFIYLRDELDDIQSKVILKSPLTGQTTASNNFSSNVSKLVDVGLNSEYYVLNSRTGVGTVSLNYAVGNNYYITTAGDTTLQISGWPTGDLGIMRVWFNVTSQYHRIMFPNVQYVGTGTIQGWNSRVLTFRSAGIYGFNLYSPNGGNTVLIEDISRPNRVENRTPPVIGQPGDVIGSTATDANYFYVCVGNYDGATGIWKRVSLSPMANVDLSISANTTSVGEGQTVTFTVTTTNIPDNTMLYWTTTGNVNANDFADSRVSGNVVIVGSQGYISRTMSEDLLLEGTEAFQIQIRGTTGNLKTTSDSITVLDTSQPATVITFDASASWTPPSGSSKIVRLSGYGSAGTIGGTVQWGDTTAPAISVNVLSSGSGTRSNTSVPVVQGVLDELKYYQTVANIGMSGVRTTTIYQTYIDVYPDGSWNKVTASAPWEILGNAVVAGVSGFDYTQFLSNKLSELPTSTSFTISSVGLQRSYITSPTTGASSTAFGKVFPGGTAGPASVTTYVENITINSGNSYNIVVPEGGSITVYFV